MTSPTTTSDLVHARATKKAFVRLVPLLMAAYFMAFVDRTNVGLAKTSLELKRKEIQRLIDSGLFP